MQIQGSGTCYMWEVTSADADNIIDYNATLHLDRIALNGMNTRTKYRYFK